MEPTPSRSLSDRIRDTRSRLAEDIDLWVSTASADGEPYLIPLSFGWDGEAVILATPASSRTARNLAAVPAVRLALGHTRDVVLVDGTAELLPLATRSSDDADRFAARAGFDPRESGSEYRWIRVLPHRIQAWREVDELADRTLMRDGAWLG